MGKEEDEEEEEKDIKEEVSNVLNSIIRQIDSKCFVSQCQYVTVHAKIVWSIPSEYNIENVIKQNLL